MPTIIEYTSFSLLSVKLQLKVIYTKSYLHTRSFSQYAKILDLLTRSEAVKSICRHSSSLWHSLSFTPPSHSFVPRWQIFCARDKFKRKCYCCRCKFRRVFRLQSRNQIYLFSFACSRWWGWSLSLKYPKVRRIPWQCYVKNKRICSAHLHFDWIRHKNHQDHVPALFYIHIHIIPFHGENPFSSFSWFYHFEQYFISTEQ